jgi:Tol biopolymer transport system component
MYPERIKGIEDKTAAIAEATYEALSKNLEVEFDYKIRIYLSDEDEVNNGFAVPFNRSYTDIWVHLNDYSEIWTGQEKWLRKVVAHELAHIFHFEAVKSPMGLFQYAIANPLPGFWTEGLAQYETEKWDSQRGDRWLRKAIFDDNLNYSSGQSLEDGRLRYALGNAQLRYFAEQYGDTTLADLFQHREKLWGLFEYHDFGDAFSETIEGGYSKFYDDWRKHSNVYYNTLAGQMERTDSLYADKLGFPGQFYFDASTSPNDSLTAILSLTSMARPVKRLHVINLDSTKRTRLIGEGGINDDLTWRNKTELLYSRSVRGENSSIINDVFLYDLTEGKEKQITKNRRAKFPIPGRHENEIAYIVNESGTGNLFTQNLETGEETRITDFAGDIQLLWPLWIETQQSWLIHKFSKNGDRNLVLIHSETGEETAIDPAEVDNRKAILSPDGSKIAYISLRDDVPNVFIYDFESETESRFTNLFTGGEVFGWLSDYDSTSTEHLVIGASENRNQDHLFMVPANREVYQPELRIPENYASWTKHAPPHQIESKIEPNPELISDRFKYQSFKNLTHVTSLGFPYYSDSDDWGFFGTTNWTEPLGKHTITAGGWVSIPDFKNESYGGLAYVNNQLYPTLTFSIYKIFENGQFYGKDFLIEEYTGGDITASWPLDLFSAPYQSSQISAKLRYYSTNPYGLNRFTGNPNVATPRSAEVSDIQLSWQIKKQRPWKDNQLHPLDGTGLKVSLSISEKVAGSDISSITTDIRAYTIQPGLGLHRIFVEGRFQSQWGNALPQQYIGFSRYDNIGISFAENIPFQFFGNNSRVIGFKEFVAGEQIAFGSLEYRIPLMPSLETELLGLISFGGVTLSMISDAGAVLKGTSSKGDMGTIIRWGSGAELKNQLSFFGLPIVHSVGFAQPTEKLFTEKAGDLYYRIKATIPF